MDTYLHTCTPRVCVKPRVLGCATYSHTPIYACIYMYMADGCGGDPSQGLYPDCLSVPHTCCNKSHHCNMLQHVTSLCYLTSKMAGALHRINELEERQYLLESAAKRTKVLESIESNHSKPTSVTAPTVFENENVSACVAAQEPAARGGRAEEPVEPTGRGEEVGAAALKTQLRAAVEEIIRRDAVEALLRHQLAVPCLSSSFASPPSVCACVRACVQEQRETKEEGSQSGASLSKQEVELRFQKTKRVKRKMSKQT